MIFFFRGEGGTFTKNQYMGGLPKAWTVCRFKGEMGLGKKEWVVFLSGGGIDTPMDAMPTQNITMFGEKGIITF